jgi:tetratricopeptide (TPR) repeat protein
MKQPSAQPTASSNAVDALYATGHWLYSEQRIEHAAAVFRALIHIAPDDERGWLGLGACHEERVQEDIALELYATASSVAGTAPRCDVARARLLKTRGLYGEAREALDQAARTADATRDESLQEIITNERKQS